MTRAKGVIRTFGSLGKTTESIELAVGTKGRPASRQDFMTISLVTNIPDQSVVWRIKDPVQGDGQFNHPQTGTEMPPFFSHGFNNELPQLLG